MQIAGIYEVAQLLNVDLSESEVRELVRAVDEDSANPCVHSNPLRDTTLTSIYSGALAVSVSLRRASASCTDLATCRRRFGVRKTRSDAQQAACDERYNVTDFQ